MTVKQTQPTVKQQAAMYGTIGKQMASSYPWWAMLFAFLVGLAVGLMVLGWLIWPVQWSNAKPSSLSTQYQQAYLNASANSLYAGMSIQDVSTNLGEGWTLDYVNKQLDQMITENYAGNKANLTNLKTGLNQLGSVGPAGAPVNQPGLSPAVAAGLALVVLILLIMGGIFIFRRLRSEAPSKTAVTTTTTTVPGQVVVEGGEVVVPAVSRAAAGARAVEKTAWPDEARAPLSQFATTYALGDDRYDMSKSIEAPNGDFLGECGVGISETIGGGVPEKATALEVWLFDKNDVRTITKVLMSEYAYNDAAIRNKMAPKGDAVAIKKGDVVELKTQTLKIGARVIDLVYGSGTPANSYFQQVTLELATWSDAIS
jgi:hypothetical protein